MQTTVRPLCSFDHLAESFAQVRRRSRALVAPLSPEDAVAQSMPDASPAKWHLAHTTWFFEQFVLGERGAPPYRPHWQYLFNSYYEAVGPRHARPQRGLLTRPALAEVLDYRAHVDHAVTRLFAAGDVDAALAARIELGLQHEQQHQELLLTDLKHLLSCNPLHPAYHAPPRRAPASAVPLRWHTGADGIVEIGHGGDGFAFDCETPRHRVLLERHQLGNRLVTNGEFREFVRDGGYRTPELWMSEGWATVQREGWTGPLYWSADGEREFTLAGDGALDPLAPVCHVSWFEADAFARWAGARLPTEAEWESAAATQAVAGQFADDGYLHPAPASDVDGWQQLYGDAWEWTASAFAPYPRFKPLPGALGEYNGKFMCGQFVLRGGSCVTPAGHVRASYRNFFYPKDRWQFTGIRLAQDC